MHKIFERTFSLALIASEKTLIRINTTRAKMGTICNRVNLFQMNRYFILQKFTTKFCKPDGTMKTKLTTNIDGYLIIFVPISLFQRFLVDPKLLKCYRRFWSTFSLNFPFQAKSRFEGEKSQNLSIFR